MGIESRDLSDFKNGARQTHKILRCSDAESYRIAKKIADSTASPQDKKRMSIKLEDRVIDMLNATRDLLY